MEYEFIIEDTACTATNGGVISVEHLVVWSDLPAWDVINLAQAMPWWSLQFLVPEVPCWGSLLQP